MADVATVIAVLMILLSSFLRAYFIYLRYKTEEGVKYNVRVYNAMPQNSNGFREGWMTRYLDGNKRPAVEFIPDDYDEDQMTNEEMKNVKPYALRARKNHILEMKGMHRKTLIVLPPSIGDLPSDLQDEKNSFARFCMKTIEDEKTENYKFDLLETNKQNEKEFAKKTGTKGLEREAFAKMEGMVDDVSKNVAKFLNKNANQQGGNY